MDSKLGNPTITAKMLENIASAFAKSSEEVAAKLASGHFHTEQPKSRLHPWLHPTKGWRNFARPRKTNRRRKLIRQGQLSVFGSR